MKGIFGGVVGFEVIDDRKVLELGVASSEIVRRVDEVLAEGGELTPDVVKRVMDEGEFGGEEKSRVYWDRWMEYWQGLGEEERDRVAQVIVDNYDWLKGLKFAVELVAEITEGKDPKKRVREVRRHGQGGGVNLGVIFWEVVKSILNDALRDQRRRI